MELLLGRNAIESLNSQRNNEANFNKELKKI